MAVKKTASLAEQLRALTDAAPGLRAAGVLSVTVDGVSARLAPAPAEASPGTGDETAAPEIEFGSTDPFFGDAKKRRREDVS